MDTAQKEFDKWCEEAWGVDFAFKARLEQVRRASIFLKLESERRTEEDEWAETNIMACAVAWALSELEKKEV